jgi:hypothetical protein
MRLRRVSKKWSEAARKTIVPLTDFRVDSPKTHDTMRVMTTALPNLQQIEICGLGWGNRWSEGEDPDEEEAARRADETTHNFEIISNFGKLRVLEIDTSFLNGRYPFLFNSFPLLQKLTIKHCSDLKWDLEMLVGFPLLKELECSFNFDNLHGDISSLRVLKDTLEKVEIYCCRNVKGNLMDLADFPHLKELRLDDTDVTGDIRDIGKNDFSSLEHLVLPKGVYGGNCEFDRISDALGLVETTYRLAKQRPSLSLLKDWCGCVHEDSPDFYDSVEDVPFVSPMYPPPLYICFVQAGPRIGYRWQDYTSSSEHYQYSACEVNWLDPEPEKESSDYGKYINELQEINSQESVYKGFHLPPTEAEYREIVTPLVRRDARCYYYHDDSDIEEWFLRR